MRNCMALNNFGTHRAWVIARAAGVAIALGFVAANLGACNREDEVAAGIDAATRKLAVLSPGATASPIPDADAATYRTLISSLKSISGQGGAGQQAAVDLLIARSQFGLAGQSASAAAALEAESLLRAADVRSALQTYLSFASQANALSQYDPDPILAEIDKQIAARETELAAARTAKQEIDASVADLRAQSRATQDRAAAEHKIEAELRQQAIRVSSVEAAALIEQASEHRRIADAFDAEAALLDAQAAQIAPLSPEAQLLIDQRTNQRDQLGRARTEVRDRDADNRERAATARGDQAAAAEAVNAAAKALATLRDSELPKLYDEATRLFGESAATANKAMKAGKSAASLAVAEARQSLGDLAWARARGYGAHAATLEALAAAKPALPDAAEYARAASAIRDSEAQALSAATEAYQAAKAAYESSGLKGDGAARAEAVANGLAATILKTSNGAIDVSSPDTPDEPQDSDQGASAPGAPADSPQAMLTQLIDSAKAGDYQSMGQHIYAPPGATRDLMNAALGMLTKIHALDEACEAKLGQRLSDNADSVAAQAKRNSVGLQSASGADINPASLNYSVSGDTATATGADLPEPLKFRRENGRWMLDGTETSGMDEQTMQTAAMMIPVMTQAIDGVIADVNAGKFKTLDEVNLALMAKMMPGGGG